jgi:SAM-dependent methyltransferase
MKSTEYEIMYRVEETHWWYRALHRLLFWNLARFMPRWKSSRILDAGCGTGAILKQLGDRPEHTGVDLSPDAIAFCRQRGLSNAICADITALPMDARSFDAVICSSVLYHRWVPDVGCALDELNRVLVPGGFLFLNLPAFDSLHSAHDEAVFGVRRFTKQQTVSVLAQHGFELQYASYWTSFLFPVAWAARYLKLSKRGRDFEQSGQLANAVLNGLMKLEFLLLKFIPLPFGVALFCVARKKNS